MDISRGLQAKCQLQFVLGICKIVLLRKDAGQQAMSSGMGWIEGLGGAEFADRLRLVLQVVPGCAQSVMRLGPFRFELCCRLKFFQGFAVVALVFQCQGEVVVRDRVVGLEVERLAVVRDRVIPGLGLGERGCTLAIGVRSLRLDIGWIDTRK